MQQWATPPARLVATDGDARVLPLLRANLRANSGGAARHDAGQPTRDADASGGDGSRLSAGCLAGQARVSASRSAAEVELLCWGSEALAASSGLCRHRSIVR